MLRPALTGIIAVERPGDESAFGVLTFDLRLLSAAVVDYQL
jgi:hypothetical protein